MGGEDKQLGAAIYMAMSAIEIEGDEPERRADLVKRSFSLVDTPVTRFEYLKDRMLDLNLESKERKNAAQQLLDLTSMEYNEINPISIQGERFGARLILAKHSEIRGLSTILNLSQNEKGEVMLLIGTLIGCSAKGFNSSRKAFNILTIGTGMLGEGLYHYLSTHNGVSSFAISLLEAAKVMDEHDGELNTHFHTSEALEIVLPILKQYSEDVTHKDLPFTLDITAEALERSGCLVEADDMRWEANQLRRRTGNED